MMKTNIKTYLLTTLLSISLFGYKAKADEGMWIPMLLEQLNEEEMISMGLELTAEDIYSINKSSLKDAIVHFGGGCTAEIISKEGLLLTNHHCGYGEIQEHSSVEHDYLKDGFWAKTKADELPNEGLTASFIKRMDDVTKQALAGVSKSMTEADRRNLISKNIKSIVENATKDTHYTAKVKPFFKGNQYFLFVIETFTDVRLVGAPPSSIGKYGADTDNWVWPRHTGDFSIFRIYADKDNKPAKYSKDNVPYTPEHSLPISVKGVKEGDFTMVFGFPGRTNEYLPSDEIDQTLNVINPAKIKLRKTSLGLMDKKMRSSQKVKIQYASKQSGISNGYKKWIGENTGLKESKGLEKRRKYEAEFTLNTKGQREFEKFKNILPKMKQLYKERQPLSLAREFFIETSYVNVSSMQSCFGIYRLLNAPAPKKSDNKEEYEKATKAYWDKMQAGLDRIKGGSVKYFKDLDVDLDREILAEILKINVKDLQEGQYPKVYKTMYDKTNGDIEIALKKIYAKSAIVNQDKLNKILSSSPKKAIKALEKDPFYKLFKEGAEHFYSNIAPNYGKIQDEINRLMRDYMDAQMQVFSAKRFYPDANSTLRLSYGKVEGMSPKDALTYHYQTYLEGVMAKYVPGDYEFDLPKKLIELYDNKDYGQYADSTGKMPVCFIASNHTTGGNSGSPALNGKGELIGLNFDRAWEGTMSDLNYDVKRCRNIMVDARYVLFIIDKFAGATRLIEEMEIVK